MALEKQKKDAARITGEMVLCQIEQDHKKKGSAPSTISVSRSVPATFLRENGHGLDTELDPVFIDRLDDALNGGGSDSKSKPIKFSSNDSGYIARISALVNGYRVLSGSLFVKSLNKLIDHSQLP